MIFIQHSDKVCGGAPNFMWSTALCNSIPVQGDLKCLNFIDNVVTASLIQFKVYDVLYKYAVFIQFVLSAFHNKDVTEACLYKQFGAGHVLDRLVRVTVYYVCKCVIC